LLVADKKTSLAFGFVLYNPEQSFYARIRLLNDLGYRTYIYDNSPDTCDIGLGCRNLPHIDYITAGKNLGLGVALSTVCAQAYYDSFENVLFFDQDTIFTEKTVSFIQKFIDKDLIKFRDEYVAITFESTDINGISENKPCQILDTDFTINSGSLFILNNLKSIGWHNERYFVDGVDYEMCARASVKGFKIGKCINTPGFNHISEQPDKIYKIFGVNLILRRYPFSRIMDIISSSIKLIFSLVISGQLKFSIKVFRSLSISLVGQILAIIIIRRVK
jgi:rhamnosyltransferase